MEAAVRTITCASPLRVCADYLPLACCTVGAPVWQARRLLAWQPWRPAPRCELSVRSCGAAAVHVVATVAQAADAGPWQKAAPAAVEGRHRLSLCFGDARGVSPHQVHLSKGCDLGARRGPCAEGMLRPLEDRACSVLQLCVASVRACA